jgi:Dockerin type I domain
MACCTGETATGNTFGFQVGAGRELLADFNGDGHVDAADYTVWRDHLGTVVRPFTFGDATGDGVVDVADLSSWQNSFGAMARPTGLLAGDFNGDGHIDAADYTIWRDHLGVLVSRFASGDANGDQFVDASDYVVWKQNFGKTDALEMGVGSAIAQLTESTLSDQLTNQARQGIDVSLADPSGPVSANAISNYGQSSLRALELIPEWVATCLDLRRPVDGNIDNFLGMAQPRRLTGRELFLASMRSERPLAKTLEIRNRALAGQTENRSERCIAEDLLSLFDESASATEPATKDSLELFFSQLADSHNGLLRLWASKWQHGAVSLRAQDEPTLGTKPVPI